MVLTGVQRSPPALDQPPPPYSETPMTLVDSTSCSPDFRFQSLLNAEDDAEMITVGTTSTRNTGKRNDVTLFTIRLTEQCNNVSRTAQGCE